MRREKTNVSTSVYFDGCLVELGDRLPPRDEVL
jgi:hypothetical protein